MHKRTFLATYATAVGGSRCEGNMTIDITDEDNRPVVDEKEIKDFRAYIKKSLQADHPDETVGGIILLNLIELPIR